MKNKEKGPVCVRIEPENRICPAFDATSIKLLSPEPDEMGFRVLDNFPEEHIQ